MLCSRVPVGVPSPCGVLHPEELVHRRLHVALGLVREMETGEALAHVADVIPAAVSESQSGSGICGRSLRYGGRGGSRHGGG